MSVSYTHLDVYKRQAKDCGFSGFTDTKSEMPPFVRRSREKTFGCIDFRLQRCSTVKTFCCKDVQLQRCSAVKTFDCKDV